MRNRRHTIQMIRLMILCLILASVTGCTNTGTKAAENSTESKEHKVQIGMSFDSFVLERWLKDRDVFMSTAQKLGGEVDVQNANGDVVKQREQIEKFIENKVDVIVLVPVDCYKVASAVEKARRAGIYVISYDRLIQGTEVDLYITVDNTAVGRAMGEVMKARLPEGGNIVMICGPEKDTNSVEVANGFEESIAGTNLTIVKKSSVKAWTSEYGTKAIDEAINEIDKIDGVMCGNDGLAGYAIKALSEKQMADNVVVTGQDADLEACQRVVEGTQAATVYKPIEDLAKKAAEYAVAFGKIGETIEVSRNYAVEVSKNGSITGITETRKNDVAQVPYYGLAPIAVTRENMDAVIIDSGFHLHDEVYLNAGMAPASGGE